MSVQDQAKQKMEAALLHLKKELSNIRTNRANPNMLDSVSVEVYGTQMRLKDIANVTTPEPRQILITPFDASNNGPIRKGIEIAQPNLQPIADGNAIRINIPPMDEAMRKEMVKQCRKKCEDGKVSIRNIRREFNDLVKKQKNNGDIPEDVMKSLEKKIQELTDNYCEQAETATSAKEKEVMAV